MKKKLFNIFCIICACLFASLGYWQVQRMEWKQGLISQAEKYRNAAPVEFTPQGYDAKANLFQKVLLRGRFLNENEMLLSAKYRSVERDKNEMGFHVLTPFRTNAGDVIFINRGWIPEDQKKAKRTGSGAVVVEGVLRENHGKAPWYMPQNVPHDDVWFWIDIPEMSKRLEEKYQLKNIKPVLVQQVKPVAGEQYPESLNAGFHFYNQHLTYVITWFSLAGLTLIMLVIYNRKNR